MAKRNSQTQANKADAMIHDGNVEGNTSRFIENQESCVLPTQMDTHSGTMNHIMQIHMKGFS